MQHFREHRLAQVLDLEKEFHTQLREPGRGCIDYLSKR